MVNPVEIRDLDYFVAIARGGSLARAADDLDMSSAALSKSLRRLETAVAAKLMERGRRGLVPTPSGKLLLDRAERLRLTIADLKREAAELASGRAGRIRVGTSPVESERVAIACTTLLAGAPELQIEVVVSTSNDQLIPRLSAGELDLVVSQVSVKYAGVVHETLCSDTFVVCASPAHPLARRRRVSLEDLAAERWALDGAGHRPRQFLEQAFLKRGLTPLRVVLESSSLTARLAAVNHSRCLGYHSRRLLQEAAAGRLCAVELAADEAAWPVSVDVMYRRDGYLPRAAQRLLDTLRRSIHWSD